MKGLHTIAILLPLQEKIQAKNPYYFFNEQ